MQREDRAKAIEALLYETKEGYIPKLTRLVIADYIENEINKARDEGYNAGWDDALGVN